MSEDSAKRKGDFLERLVHDLHSVVGNRVEHNVQLPTVDGTGRTRQIDVLLDVTGEEFGDCPVRFLIECKNYGCKISIEEIDAFVGKLDDIGIPSRFGIFVGVQGYTKDAIARAKAAGIKLLNAEGLTQERLALEIQEALHGVVFWVATWTTTTIFPFLPSNASFNQRFSVEVSGTVDSPAKVVLDEIWTLWLSGQMPCEFMEHSVFVRYSDGRCAIGDVQISAHGANIRGQMSSAGLAKAGTGETELQHIHTKADIPEGGVTLTAYASQEEMEDTLRGCAVRLDVRTPRIIGPSMYWPPTVETMQRLMEFVKKGEQPSFVDIEGRNLLRAWTHCE